MKITLDTKFNGSMGLITLGDAVAQLKAQDLACKVPPAAVERKGAAFVTCVERGFTPLRSEIMAACYLAQREAATEEFGRGVITEVELQQKHLDLTRAFLGGAFA
ncbi:hypothetical protein [Nonomuraea sp. LPB2021202275-12-8]|uniref:hypothetical protein n=1 Tax=Nonomuraea sp. LPB2021202275-12-8 TaxID=3120159 RepID=UPI00300DB538